MATLNNQMVTSDHQKVMWAVSRLAVLDHSRLKELQVLLEGQETLRLLAEKAAFCRGETGDFKQAWNG